MRILSPSGVTIVASRLSTAYRSVSMAQITPAALPAI